MISVSEERVFSTIQGEGKFIGYPTTFLRLNHCNLRCQWQNKDGSFTKCDTPYTSFEPKGSEFTVEDLVKEVCDEAPHHVCITGGEPYFQKESVDLINALVEKGKYLTIESNGTIYRPSKAQFISLSPKLSSSSKSPIYGHKHELQRLKYDSLEKFITNHDYQFKFVINSDEEIREIYDIRDNLLDRTGKDISEHIWLMPQGIEKAQFEEKYEWLAEICKREQWKLTPRLHILIWGHRAGV